VQYIPTIYGFKIFGQKGSKFELVFDNMGQAKNQKDVDGILKRKQGAPGNGSFIGAGALSPKTSAGGGAGSMTMMTSGDGGMMQSKQPRGP